MIYQRTNGKRGFAAMDPVDQIEIARKGGQQAHKSGKAHKWTTGSEEAREAGRKGGSISKRRPKEV
jgi:uncharacterized protein